MQCSFHPFTVMLRLFPLPHMRLGKLQVPHLRKFLVVLLHDVLAGYANFAQIQHILTVPMQLDQGLVAKLPAFLNVLGKLEL